MGFTFTNIKNKHAFKKKKIVYTHKTYRYVVSCG